MSYRHDSDLEFLASVKSEDMEDLVHCLTYDTDGEVRFTEELTTNEQYKAHHPDHHQYWQLVAAEIQCFGANTFATVLRGGHGVEYKEVLTDVCDKLKVNFNKYSSAEQIETNLLMKVLSDALEKMSPQELKELAEATGVKNTSGLTPETMAGVFQAVFRAGGFKSYQLSLIIVNAIWKAIFKKGLSLATNSTITKVLSILTGPVGWVVTSTWTAIDIAGPAYRVTIPAVIQVAVLRQKHLYAAQAKDVAFS